MQIARSENTYHGQNIRIIHSSGIKLAVFSYSELFLAMLLSLLNGGT